MMMPVRSFEISASSRPASRIAWSMATWFQAVPPPWKRMARRSTISSAFEVAARRGPGSGSRARRTGPPATMPDLASRSEASTSCVLFPMDETMPMPVTTTRLIAHSSGRERPRLN